MAETPTVVNEPVTTAQPSDGTPPVVKEEATPGTKTDSALLLKSLQEEREKRRELEEELTNLKSSVPSDEVFSDEGKALKSEINILKSELSEVEGTLGPPVGFSRPLRVGSKSPFSAK